MGCPGSRAKFEFNSWESRGTVARNKMEQTTINASLEWVILPLCWISFLGFAASERVVWDHARSTSPNADRGGDRVAGNGLADQNEPPGAGWSQLLPGL